MTPVERIRAFVGQRERMLGLDPELVYSVQSNPEGEPAELRMSDLRAAIAQLDRIAAVALIVYRHGQPDEANHSAWVIDQIVRTLLGDGYEAWVQDYIDGGTDGLDVFTWNVGIAP